MEKWKNQKTKSNVTKPHPLFFGCAFSFLNKQSAEHLHKKKGKKRRKEKNKSPEEKKREDDESGIRSKRWHQMQFHGFVLPCALQQQLNDEGNVKGVQMSAY